MLLTKVTAIIRAKLTQQNIYRLVMYSGKEVLMAVQGQRGTLTHLKGVTPMQHLWHRRFRHASHARVKLASTMVNGLFLHQMDEPYEAGNQSISDLEHLSPEDSECLSPDMESHSAEGLSHLSSCTTEPLAALLPDDNPQNVCIPCVQSKQTRIVQHTPMRITNRILERLHSDLWGPHDPESLGGSSYAVVLVDDYSKKSWVDF